MCGSSWESLLEGREFVVLSGSFEGRECAAVWESLLLRAGNVWFCLGESFLEGRECVVLSGRVVA